MTFKLGARSIERLQGVHPDLVRVVHRAIALTPVDFTVLEGLRSPERQKTLVASGASQTLNSRHITGHAVDLGAWVDNQVDWSWPLYTKIANAMKASANELGISIVWGGDWKTFKDGPHFELDRKVYP
jgi:peptidoglycan L-alanyl-D-glutamate endopeptidase CwlK